MPIVYKVVIADVDVTQYVAVDRKVKIKISERLNKGNTANITLRTGPNISGLNIQTGDVTEIWFDNILFFKGTIGEFTPTIKKVRTTVVREYVLPIEDHNYICNRRLYTNAFENELSGDIVKDIVDGVLFEDGITYTVQSIQNGRMIIEAAYESQRITDVLDELAKTNGFYWYIDVHKVLWFRAMDYTNTAPFVITDDESNIADNFRLFHNTLKLKFPRTQYRNRMYVRGYGVTNVITDLFSYDGFDTTFSCGFQLFELMQVYLNGVLQSFDVDGVAAFAEFLWKFGENTVRASKDKAPTLQEGDLITIVYRGRFPIIVSAEDRDEITRRAAIENTSGIYESTEENTEIYGFSRLQELINSKLETASRIPTIINYSTQYQGIRPAMLQQITSTGDAYNISLNAVIEDVDIELDANAKPTHLIKATAGSTLERWTEWFKSVKMAAESALISKGSVTLGIKTQDVILLTDGVAVLESTDTNRWDQGVWDVSQWG